jgi:hypothetical protein
MRRGLVVFVGGPPEKIAMWEGGHLRKIKFWGGHQNINEYLIYKNQSNLPSAFPRFRFQDFTGGEYPQTVQNFLSTDLKLKSRSKDQLLFIIYVIVVISFLVLLVNSNMYVSGIYKYNIFKNIDSEGFITWVCFRVSLTSQNVVKNAAFTIEQHFSARQ